MRTRRIPSSQSRNLEATALFCRSELGHSFRAVKLGDHRFALATLHVGEMKFCFVSCYFPCRGSYKDEAFSETAEDLACIVSSFPDHQIFVMGDFNADLLGGDRRARLFWDVIAPYHIKLPDSSPPQMTYSHPNGDSRFDFLLTRPTGANPLPIATRVISADPINTSHHATVVGVITVPNSTGGDRAPPSSDAPSLPPRFRWRECKDLAYEAYIRSIHSPSCSLMLRLCRHLSFVLVKGNKADSGQRRSSLPSVKTDQLSMRGKRGADRVMVL